MERGGSEEKTVNDKESVQEMRDRVQQMAIDNGGTWDLSENDKFALQCVLDIASAFCPVHAQLVATHREDFPACVQCVVNRLREWLEGIRDFAERTMPHAQGQGH